MTSMARARTVAVAMALCGALQACGGAPAPAEAPGAAPLAETPEATGRRQQATREPPGNPSGESAETFLPERAANATSTREVPSRCESKDDCYPPRAFTNAVCKKKFPDLPLYLFAARMPWQHRYVKAEWVEPVNPHGGEQSEAWMQFGEEVVLLGRSGAKPGKGVQISGPSDVDVLRWDGTCATIREEMLVSYVPAPMKSPRIIWKYLASDLQEALLKHPLVARSREAERKSCRDSSLTHPTPGCEKAMRQLTDAIALAVHQNIELPATGSVPEWVKPEAEQERQAATGADQR